MGLTIHSLFVPLSIKGPMVVQVLLEDCSVRLFADKRTCGYGSGDGFGSGKGGGFGSGIGRGYGSGDGDGCGLSLGDGYGLGDGLGDGNGMDVVTWHSEKRLEELTYIVEEGK